MLARCSDNWQYTWAFTSKALTLYQCNDNNFYQVTSVFPDVVLLKMCFIWHLVQECLIMLNLGRLQRWSPSFFRRQSRKLLMFFMFQWTIIPQHHVYIIIPYNPSSKIFGGVFGVCHIKLGFSVISHLNSCHLAQLHSSVPGSVQHRTRGICSSQYLSKTFPAIALLARSS